MFSVVFKLKIMPMNFSFHRLRLLLKVYMQYARLFDWKVVRSIFVAYLIFCAIFSIIGDDSPEQALSSIYARAGGFSIVGECLIMFFLVGAQVSSEAASFHTLLPASTGEKFVGTIITVLIGYMASLIIFILWGVMFWIAYCLLLQPEGLHVVLTVAPFDFGSSLQSDITFWAIITVFMFNIMVSPGKHDIWGVAKLILTLALLLLSEDLFGLGLPRIAMTGMWLSAWAIIIYEMRQSYPLFRALSVSPELSKELLAK